ncbi:CYTH domain-containing protein [Sansalvadorimonas sp. 2012CJ34-2]|uniref:CYTH domain-containing protein n=1 Tax=Parendozoicomonas callyspongiae TaxID=2942213 RepID=A0ABT0PCZ0_9GAMM|nr:CYTH domain-containing protein [Sansalvadorimonas sp. 2012CJ34-2]MCL6269235.1 CYTH domain-containing protein [Sansalvadorimonas sp. 2012CJ34-2]
MSSEVELKLLLTPEDHQSVLVTPCLAGKEVDIQHLDNTYFDTPGFDLMKNRAALRIRKKGDRYIQTLKTLGTSVDGLSRRGEWEWNLGEPVINEQELEKVWPENLQGIYSDSLRPVFQTDFERRVINLEWQGASIELALDDGWIITDSGRQRISELELELKSGPEAALHDLARVLGEGVDLTPCDISKAERGYQLVRF